MIEQLPANNNGERAHDPDQLSRRQTLALVLSGGVLAAVAFAKAYENPGPSLVCDTHTVQQGETLSQIAVDFHKPLSDFEAANKNNIQGRQVRAEQIITIPGTCR